MKESPAWKRSKAEGAQPKGQEKPKEKAKVGASVLFLAISGFFWGLSFSIMVSMFGLWALSRWDLDALRVSFVMAAGSVVSVVTNILITPRLQQWSTEKFRGDRVRGIRFLSVITQFISSGCRYGMIVVPNTALKYVWGSIAATTVGRAFDSIGMPGRTTILGAITVASTRGQQFARVQMMTNLGRFVGPIVSGVLAEEGPKGDRDWGDPENLGHKGIEFYVWYLSVGASVLSACLLYFVPLPTPKPKEDVESIQRTGSAGGIPRLESGLQRLMGDPTCEDWVDEEGTEEDERALGRWLALLLRRRHYRWVSDRDEVLRMVARSIPTADSTDDHLGEIARVFEADQGCLEKSTMIQRQATSAAVED
eukprot:Hpha_TRINITY_DN16626_c4_g3::TRINITY_DN16626_c4_g3_i1::g.178312::m.178312